MTNQTRMDDKLYETTWNLVTQREGVLRGTMDDIFHKKLKPTTHTACEDLDLVAHYNPDHVKHVCTMYVRTHTLCMNEFTSEKTSLSWRTNLCSCHSSENEL